jgi:hypothetical protein
MLTMTIFNCNKDSERYAEYEKVLNLWNNTIYIFKNHGYRPTIEESKILIVTIQRYFNGLNALKWRIYDIEMNHIADFMSRIVKHFIESFNGECELSQEYVGEKLVSIIHFIGKGEEIKD